MFFALVLVISGCTPAGPRALLNGKKSLDQGDLTAAVAQLKTATTLLATNAQAWNYYGVALQRTGQPDDAAAAYRQALELNRDLLEAHFNLGTLALEQNKPDLAKTEFTAYTLRRPNDAAGWLKLGSAQLKLGEIVPAERCFSTVLALKTNGDAEAYNGLGLARIQRGKAHDAAQFFAAAVQIHADFAPALLNLATVSQQYLHDNKRALENFRAYLALTPRPANWDEVNGIANSLEQAQAIIAMTAAKAKPTPSETQPTPKVSTSVATRPAVSNPPGASVKTAPTHLVAMGRTPGTANSVAPPPAPVQAVPVAPAPNIVAARNPTGAPPLEVPLPEPEKKPGFWNRLFGSEKTERKPEYIEKGVTPLPSDRGPLPQTAARPVDVAPPVTSFARYRYTSPRPPAAGDRRSASGAFTKARLLEQEEKWIDALTWYRTATQIDPAWFEAQYNTGVLAHRLRNYPLALPSYEQALVLAPDSVDTRYNFSLALKAAGYGVDAAEELKKILAANPGDVRAHLALANLCAQSLHAPAQARAHYLKVLELDPNHGQAADIRFWLAANPP